jgi:disulfide bond formation protein DsbB
MVATMFNKFFKQILSNKKIAITAIIGVPVFAIVFALVAQYGFGLKPCILCIYQRIVFGVAIVLGSLFFISKYRKTIIILMILTYGVNGLLAFFHVGVENKWWKGTDECGATITAKTVDELRTQIINAPVVRCEDKTVIIFGITFTQLNLILSLIMTKVLSSYLFFMRRRQTAFY